MSVAIRLGAMIARTSRIAPSDEDLAAVIAERGGSDPTARDAFAQLYERHARPLLSFLSTRIRRNDLDDLHQEVWQRVWKHLPDGFRGGHFRGWLFQIARNSLIDHGRRKRPDRLDEEEALPDVRLDAPEASLVEHERMEALKRCLERLTAEAAALVRARLGGESYPDLCQRLGLRPERAHKLFHLAKDQLQACVERALS
jgi:RNA polymerase sigma-70 factor, ECF subfamily